MRNILSFKSLMLSLLLTKLAITAPTSTHTPIPTPKFAHKFVPEYNADPMPPFCHAESNTAKTVSTSTTQSTSPTKSFSKWVSRPTPQFTPKSRFTLKSLLVSTSTTVPEFTHKSSSKYTSTSKSSSTPKPSSFATFATISISAPRISSKSTPIFPPTSISSSASIHSLKSTSSSTVIVKSISTKSILTIPTKSLSTSSLRATSLYTFKPISKSLPASASASLSSSFSNSHSSSVSSSSRFTTSSALFSTIASTSTPTSADTITSTLVSTLATKLISTSLSVPSSTTESVSSTASFASSSTISLTSSSTSSSATELVSSFTSSSTIELASSSNTLPASSSVSSTTTELVSSTASSSASSSTTSSASSVGSSSITSPASSVTSSAASSSTTELVSSTTSSSTTSTDSSSTTELVSLTTSSSITSTDSSSTTELVPSTTFSSSTLNVSSTTTPSTTGPVSSSTATFTTVSTTSASNSDTTSVTSSSASSDTTSATFISTLATKQISTSSSASSSSSSSVPSNSTSATTSFTSTITSTSTSTSSITPVSSSTVIDRATWANGFTIGTDYELSTPSGGSRSYNFEVTEHYNWVGPDGVVKDYVQLINGQLPGPTLYAQWGDTITVTVTNKLPANGTGFHWHGLRQFETNIQDGANGVTECPLAPNKTRTYTLHATQYGTSWYHSHFSAQYGNGVYGTIHIDGPASANYDLDLGVYPISDYYYLDADALVVATKTAPPPASDNILFNGTNINPADPSNGNYSVVTLTPGSVHRLRLINPSVENHYQVSLVGHEFTIIATDFVPIEPVVASDIFIGVGQRYDVLINATEAIDNYWFNVTLGTSGLCGTSNNPFPAAIFRYEGAPDALPTATGTVPADAGCQDVTTYAPVVTRTADVNALLTDTADPTHELDISLFVNTTFIWEVNSSAVNVQWEKPVLQYVIDGNTSYPEAENLVFVDEQNVWTYWIIQNLSPLPHPMHLHGHDYLILGSVPGANFSSSDSSTLNFNNPARRDVTMLPANGYLILAFKADNPGNWLFHCHIAWHVSGGLSADFMENRDQQLALISDADLAQYNQICEWWQEWEPSAPPKIDSGLRR